ncbi:hypothetical protein OfM1_20280 [Lactovum odontotermitis]
METKTRVQGNSLTLTVPKSFHIKEGVVVEPELKNDGIFYRFVKEDQFFDYDADILRDLISDGLAGEELIAAFKEKKRKIPLAFEAIKKEASKAKPMSRKEFEREIGL